MNITLPPMITVHFERTDGKDTWEEVESGDVVLSFGYYEIARKAVHPDEAYYFGQCSDGLDDRVTEFAAGMLKELFDAAKKATIDAPSA